MLIQTQNGDRLIHLNQVCEIRATEIGKKGRPMWAIQAVFPSGQRCMIATFERRSTALDIVEDIARAYASDWPLYCMKGFRPPE